MNKTILVAGATGNLGGRIVDALLERGANLTAAVRAESEREAVGRLREKGVTIRQTNLFDVGESPRRARVRIASCRCFRVCAR